MRRRTITVSRPPIRAVTVHRRHPSWRPPLGGAARASALLGRAQVWNNAQHLCQCRDTYPVSSELMPLGMKEDGWRHVLQRDRNCYGEDGGHG